MHGFIPAQFVTPAEASLHTRHILDKPYNRESHTQVTGVVLAKKTTVRGQGQNEMKSDFITLLPLEIKSKTHHDWQNAQEGSVKYDPYTNSLILRPHPTYCGWQPNDMATLLAPQNEETLMSICKKSYTLAHLNGRVDANLKVPQWKEKIDTLKKDGVITQVSVDCDKHSVVIRERQPVVIELTNAGDFETGAYLCSCICVQPQRVGKCGHACLHSG
jgi:hypothetical protein